LAYFGLVINSDYIALNGGMSDKRWSLCVTSHCDFWAAIRK